MYSKTFKKNPFVITSNKTTNSKTQKFWKHHCTVPWRKRAVTISPPLLSSLSYSFQILELISNSSANLLVLPSKYVSNQVTPQFSIATTLVQINSCLLYSCFYPVFCRLFSGHSSSKSMSLMIPLLTFLNGVSSHSA